MSGVRWTNRSRQDLLDIWVHIAANDERTADRIAGEIAFRCSELRDFPEMGRARPDIAPDVRALVIKRWLALYRLLPGVVQIVRIVDGARDLGNLELPTNREL